MIEIKTSLLKKKRGLPRMGVSWRAGTGSDTQNNKIVNKIDSMLLKEIHVQNKNKPARWLRVGWSLVGVLMYSLGALVCIPGVLVHSPWGTCVQARGAVYKPGVLCACLTTGI